MPASRKTRSVPGCPLGAALASYFCRRMLKNCACRLPGLSGLPRGATMVPSARGSGSWNRLSSGPNRLPHALNRMLRILNRLHWILNRIIVTYLDVSRFEMTCGNVISLRLHAQFAVGKGRPRCGADPSSESQACSPFSPQHEGQHGGRDAGETSFGERWQPPDRRRHSTIVLRAMKPICSRLARRGGSASRSVRVPRSSRGRRGR